MFVGSVAAVVACIVLLVNPGTTRYDPFMMWFSLSFFGLCAIVGGIMLFPGSGSLTLDREGFVITNLFRPHRFAWKDVGDFTVYDAGQGRPFVKLECVVFNCALSSQQRITQVLSKHSRQLVGRDGALPDTYGMAASELAALMEGWRERAATSPRSTSAGIPPL